MPYKTKRFTRKVRDRLQKTYTQSSTPFWMWLSSTIIERKLTENALAAQLGIDRHNLQAWRRGSLPSAVTCYKLANVLKIRLAVVYAMANIPLKADHELMEMDRFGIGSLTDSPQCHLLALIQRQPYPELFKTAAMLAIGQLDTSD